MTFRLSDYFLPEESEVQRNPLSTLITELVFYGFLSYMFVIVADRYSSAENYGKPSTLLFVFHWMFLYIHEGGHFLFSFFGRTLNILGGSFWQVVFPLLSFLLALKQRSRIAPFPLLLTGFNLMAVSLYMLDAPLRRLPLLGGDKSRHDWYNLFTLWGMLDSAVTVADIIYYIGFGVSIVALAGGFYLAFTAFRKPSIAADVPLQSSVRQALRKESERIS